MNKKLLVKVSGNDQLGITSKIMALVVQSNITLLDMGQSVTHGLLSLSILIDINKNSSEYEPFLKDMLFLGQNLSIDIAINEFKLRDDEIKKYYPQDNQKYILSCISESNIPASFIFEVSSILAKSNINIRQISNPSINHFKAIELKTVAPLGINLKEFNKDLLKISEKHKIDLAFLKDNIYRRSKRLIVFDMDSTLIQAEVIDEMAKVYGVGDKVTKITEQAMNGEIDFTQSLNNRVSLLKGMEVKELHKILERLPLTKGTEDFIKRVKTLGYKVAVISGGFSFFAKALQQKLQLDYAFANELEIVNNKLTGKIIGDVVDAKRKALLLNLMAQQEQISLEQVVAIGDGANDLPMLSAAGLGIAFHAKKIVKEKANYNFSHGPMTHILNFLGIPEEET